MNLTTRLVLALTAVSLALTAVHVVADSGAVALTKADPSCGDPTTHPSDAGADRYFDCKNGTVTDDLTGLTWLQKPGCLTSKPLAGAPGVNPSGAKLDWDRATIEAHNLSHGVCDLQDNSRPGDWRMPTKDEWEQMIDTSCTGPALSDETGDKCASESTTHVFDFSEFCGGGDNQDYYWSATTDTSGGSNTDAFTIELFDGSVHTDPKTFVNCLWPVRISQGPGGEAP